MPTLLLPVIKLKQQESHSMAKSSFFESANNKHRIQGEYELKKFRNKHNFLLLFYIATLLHTNYNIYEMLQLLFILNNLKVVLYR
jgi:hypothetical protein